MMLCIALCASLFATDLGAQDRSGSIYRPDSGPRSIIGSKIAFRRGDIVTVVIKESQSVQNQEASDLSRGTTLDYGLSAFDIRPTMFSTLPRIGADSSETFAGSANYAKKGAFEARLASIVVDVLPNGNMVVSGRREIRIDKETKLIEFSGIVRRFDIANDNTVQSELVANAEIRYRGQGPLTDSTQRYGLGGFIHRWFGWLWPF
ncbi:MAG TPA: flagellar basal body L-ring protein FlgH [Planctomycetota bacterium]|nr:flagellar basal body L-ring protein FlgH [Planctomycetota bacterium]